MAPSSSALASALLIAVFSQARAACPEFSVQQHVKCAPNAYAVTKAASEDECCALCTSDEQCAQWSFCRVTRRCSRTTTSGSEDAGLLTWFSSCGIRGVAPTPPAPPVPSTPKEWAVIVAGSSGYGNYRHQADACHAYQIAKGKGIPEEQIILMAYDDIAGDSENPFPGKLFNKPDPTGPGKDVYAGCKIDYKGEQVTPANFLQVLSGKGTGKVLKSTSEDHVFVFFTDHGATGLIAFPSDELHKEQLQSTIQQMYVDKMFKQLVFYLESCESGSMFEGMKTPGAYGLSASSPDESSWGTYCDDTTNVVNGTSLGTCLGDLFSVSWMEDSDVEDTTKETLQKQFGIVKNLTNLSHVQQWGDLSFTSEPVSQFIGPNAGGKLIPDGQAAAPKGSVSTRQVDLHRQFQRYMSSTTSEARLVAAAGLQRELTRQLEVELVYMRFSELVYPGDSAKQAALRTDRTKPDHAACELRVHRAIRTECATRFDANSGFALQFHQIVVNACQAVARGLDVDLVAQATQACKESDSQKIAASELVV